MDRINGLNTVDIGGGRRGFRDQNLAAGIAGTQVTASFLTGEQEEIVSFIEWAGLSPSPTDNTQLRQAVLHAIDVPGRSGTGWIKLFDGLILQWGTVVAAAYSTSGSYLNTDFNFPMAFPTAVLSIGGSLTQGIQPNAYTSWSIESRTRFGARFVYSGGVTTATQATLTYVAIGN